VSSLKKPDLPNAAKSIRHFPHLIHLFRLFRREVLRLARVGGKIERLRDNVRGPAPE
jgi:hypothetical protein